jgi:ABC-type sugar transport system substrate-binding protein
VEVVYELTANWTTDEALAVVETWLSSGKDIQCDRSHRMTVLAMGALKWLMKMRDGR